jgi:putative endonuclease
MNKNYYVYIMTNKRNTVLYTGVTNNLIKRCCEHKEKVVEGFTKKYNVNKLVYYEIFDSAIDAISREKQIKAGSRSKKLMSINKMNPDWKDLYAEIL